MQKINKIELLGIDFDTSYFVAFSFIRKLAIHLRNSYKQKVF